MKVNIETLRQEGKKSFYYKGKVDEITIESMEVLETEVEYRLDLLDEEVIVRGEYFIKLKTDCVRCLKEIVLEVNGDLFGQYEDSKIFQEKLSKLGSETQSTGDLTEELIDNEVNISKLITEHILLDMPQYPTCLPECEENDYLDKYKDDGIDPRWQQLLNIKK